MYSLCRCLTIEAEIVTVGEAISHALYIFVMERRT